MESDTNPADKSYMMEGKFESKEALHPQNELSNTEPRSTDPNRRKAEPQINVTNFVVQQDENAKQAEEESGTKTLERKPKN